MRAYLSDLDKRSRWLDYLETHHTATIEETGVSPEDWVLNTAWAEARAILAETEPETLDASHVPASSLRWYDVAPREASYRLMLAEALAAFVGEPCRCAGGMHWSPERGYYHCNGIMSEA